MKYTRFERLAIRWAPEIALWATCWGVIWALWAAATTWVHPGLPTAQVWVQIGWALLIMLAAAILGLIVDGLVEREVKRWANRRANLRHFDWLAEQWGINR